MLKAINNLVSDKSGATAIEYALIASLIAVVAIAGMRTIGQNVRDKLNTISNTINDTNSAK